MSDNKMPPRDQKELERIRKLFEKGLSEAAKDPEKFEYIRREKEQLIKPWEDYMKDWKPSNKQDSKKASGQSVLDAFQEALRSRRGSR